MVYTKGIHSFITMIIQNLEVIERDVIPDTKIIYDLAIYRKAIDKGIYILCLPHIAGFSESFISDTHIHLLEAKVNPLLDSITTVPIRLRNGPPHCCIMGETTNEHRGPLPVPKGPAIVFFSH